MENEICRNCRWWKSEDDFEGKCHRHAPRPGAQLVTQAVLDDEKQDVQWLSTHWPSVYAEEFCGEFTGRTM